MDASDYQKQAQHSYINKPDFPLSDHDLMIVRYALGLAGEAGEVANYVKKSVFRPDGENTLDPCKLEDELGDVLWYVAALCSITGLDLGGVMERNIEKIKRRYPEGWPTKTKTRPISVAETIKRINANVDRLWEQLKQCYGENRDPTNLTQRKLSRYALARRQVENKLPPKRSE